MFPTPVLRQHVCRLTLFTRANCGLCDNAKKVLENVWYRRPFEYDEIDVMSYDKWKDVYEFDTPVVHIDKIKENSSDFSTTTRARKLMHRFKVAEIEKLMDEAMMNPSSPSSS
ncbi:glutaredoxin-like domain-containing protein [Delphinella strobiligena]|nr:glutaredoxin-like domain-containing protein [Delphinella strobiligena]